MRCTVRTIRAKMAHDNSRRFKLEYLLHSLRPELTEHITFSTAPIIQLPKESTIESSQIDITKIMELIYVRPARQTVNCHREMGSFVPCHLNDHKPQLRHLRMYSSDACFQCIFIPRTWPEILYTSHTQTHHPPKKIWTLTTLNQYLWKRNQLKINYVQFS